MIIEFFNRNSTLSVPNSNWAIFASGYYEFIIFGESNTKYAIRMTFEFWKYIWIYLSFPYSNHSIFTARNNELKIFWYLNGIMFWILTSNTWDLFWTFFNLPCSDCAIFASWINKFIIWWNWNWSYGIHMTSNFLNQSATFPIPNWNRIISVGRNDDFFILRNFY